MAKPNGANGKTSTHFEQIPVAIVEKIAIADIPDDREVGRKLADRTDEPGKNYVIRRAGDRLQSRAMPPPPPRNES